MKSKLVVILFILKNALSILASNVDSIGSTNTITKTLDNRRSLKYIRKNLHGLYSIKSYVGDQRLMSDKDEGNKSSDSKNNDNKSSSNKNEVSNSNKREEYFFNYPRYGGSDNGGNNKNDDGNNKNESSNRKNEDNNNNNDNNDKEDGDKDNSSNKNSDDKDNGDDKNNDNNKNDGKDNGNNNNGSNKNEVEKEKEENNEKDSENSNNKEVEEVKEEDSDNQESDNGNEDKSEEDEEENTEDSDNEEVDNEDADIENEDEEESANEEEDEDETNEDEENSEEGEDNSNENEDEENEYEKDNEVEEEETSSPTASPTNLTYSPTSQPTEFYLQATNSPTTLSTNATNQIVVTPMPPFELILLSPSASFDEDLFLEAVKYHLQNEYELSLPTNATLQDMSLALYTTNRKLLEEVDNQLYRHKYSFYGSSTLTVPSTTHFDYLTLPLGVTLRAFNDEGLYALKSYLYENSIVNAVTMKFKLASSTNQEQETEPATTLSQEDPAFSMYSIIKIVCIASVALFTLLCTYYISTRYCKRCSNRKKKLEKPRPIIDLRQSSNEFKRSQNVHSNFKDDASLFPSIAMETNKKDDTKTDEVAISNSTVDDASSNASSNNNYSLSSHSKFKQTPTDEESCNESWIVDNDNYSQISFSDYYNLPRMDDTTAKIQPKCITSWESNIKRETSDSAVKSDSIKDNLKAKFDNGNKNKPKDDLFPTVDKL